MEEFQDQCRLCDENLDFNADTECEFCADCAAGLDRICKGPPWCDVRKDPAEIRRFMAAVLVASNRVLEMELGPDLLRRLAGGDTEETSI